MRQFQRQTQNFIEKVELHGIRLEPEWKTGWVEALRSGEYKQTHGVLRNDRGYCCLGVLCEIVQPEIGREWVYEDENKSYVFMDEETMPPDLVWKKTLKSDSHSDTLCDALTSLNDCESLSFAEIADWVEENL